jgi:hypothetical protein
LSGVVSIGRVGCDEMRGFELKLWRGFGRACLLLL